MEEIETVKKSIVEEIEKFGFHVVNIMLFGSRARGDFKTDSDWDLLVIVDKDISPQIERKIMDRIYRGLAKFENSYEVVLKSRATFNKMKHIVGSICYEAESEGKVIWKR